MFDLSQALPHLRAAEDEAGAFADGFAKRLQAAREFVAELEAGYASAQALLEKAKTVRSSVEGAANAVPTLADVKALVDRLV